VVNDRAFSAIPGGFMPILPVSSLSRRTLHLRTP
jgi:hypothetical protein